ncbi:MAG: hypothetical protein AB9856_18290 [Cellulosilyticaceae bacterium]
MVTIEQKMSLFSKLLQQDVKNDTIEKLELLDKEYEEKIQESKVLIDKESEDFVENALKKANIKRIEAISKAKMDGKKYAMAAKEKNLGIFMNKLDERCKLFTTTEGYKKFLEEQVSQCKELKDDQDAYLLGMTHKDCDQYGKYVIESLVAIGIKEERLTLVEKDDTMLGGFVLEVLEKNTRIDLSIRAVIAEHKDSIVEKIFAAMEEDGDGLE